jgi:hypothetical protein
MLDFLFHLTDVRLFTLLIGLGFVIALLGVTMVRIIVPHELRLKDNSVIGSVGALVGLIYGVLVGITSLYLINNLTATSDAVQREANGLANIYRSATWLKEPARDNLLLLVKNYLNEATDVEWPAMKRGEAVSEEGDLMIDKMSNELRAYPVATQSDALIVRDLLEEVRSLYNAREDRLAMSNSELSAELWVVILIGTFLTMGINFLYGMNIYLHYLTSCIGALMASSMIFLLLTLDRPFQGDFVIEPDSFRAVLSSMEKKALPAPIPTSLPQKYL